MNTELLRTFVVLAEEGHLQRAADRLHLSPQAVSKALANLEGHYGARLLERDHRIRGLSPAGEALLHSARALLAAEEATERAVQAAKAPRPQGPVAIGGDNLWHHHLLPPVLKAVLAEHPEVQPGLHELLPPDVERLVAEGELDFGLLLAAPTRSDLDWHEGLATPYVIVGRPELKGQAWQGLNYIAPRILGRELGALDGWDATRFPRRVVATVELLETAMSLVEAGVGVAFVPQLAVEARVAAGRLAVVAKAPVRFEDRLFVVWRKGVPPTPAARVLLDAVLAAGAG